MKYFLLFTLLTSAAFAMDFNKVTGTFDVGSKKEFAEEAESTLLTGTFSEEKTSRLPASQKNEKAEKHVTEITGSFEK